MSRKGKKIKTTSQTNNRCWCLGQSLSTLYVTKLTEFTKQSLRFQIRTARLHMRKLFFKRKFLCKKNLNFFVKTADNAQFMKMMSSGIRPYATCMDTTNSRPMIGNGPTSPRVLLGLTVVICVKHCSSQQQGSVNKEGSNGVVWCRYCHHRHTGVQNTFLIIQIICGKGIHFLSLHNLDRGWEQIK